MIIIIIIIIKFVCRIDRSRRDLGGRVFGRGERKSKLTLTIWCKGKTSLEFPAYMDFAQDQNTGKALLKIPDRTVRKHREMWGLFCS